MIKRWIEPIMCFLIVVVSYICSSCSNAYFFLGPITETGFEYYYEKLARMRWAAAFPFEVYQSTFLWISIIAVIGGILLMRYRKIGVPILLAMGLAILLGSPFFIASLSIHSETYTLALMPIILAFGLIIISIIALIRKPLEKEKLEAIKKELE